MVSKCLIANCIKRQGQDSNLSFHKFPIDPKKRRAWIIATKIKKEDIKTRSVICSRHFKANDYITSGKNILKKEAVPTLNISSKSSPKKLNILNKHNILKAVPKQVNKEDEVKKSKNVKIKLNSNNSSKTVDKKQSKNGKPSGDLKKSQISNVSVNQIKKRTRTSQVHSRSVKRQSSDNEGSVVKKFKPDENESSKKIQSNKKKQDNANKSLPNENLPSTTNTMTVSDKLYWTSFQETITEMQEKIKKLESKSIQDEKKIENFHKIVLQQKQEEIKALIEGKENELLLRMDGLCLDYNPKRICRLCLLEKGGPLIQLFQPKQKSLLIQKIKTWTGIEVEKEDGMPSGICCECSIQMERADWFKKRSEKANTLLKKFIQMKQTANTMREMCKAVQFCEEESAPQTGYTEFPVKIEIEDVFTLTDSAEEHRFEVSVKEEIEDVNCDENSCSKSLNVSVITDSKPTLKVCKPKKYFCKKCNKSAYKCQYKQTHAIQCLECMRYFWDRESVKKHLLLRFNCIVPQSKRTCYVCNITFRWKWQLNIHCWQHRKVKYHSCKICEEQFTFLPQLKAHITTHF